MGLGTPADVLQLARDLDETHLLVAQLDPSDGTIPRIDLIMRYLQGPPGKLRSVARFADLQMKTGGLVQLEARAAIDGRAVRAP